MCNMMHTFVLLLSMFGIISANLETWLKSHGIKLKNAPNVYEIKLPTFTHEKPTPSYTFNIKAYVQFDETGGNHQLYILPNNYYTTTSSSYETPLTDNSELSQTDIDVYHSGRHGGATIEIYQPDFMGEVKAWVSYIHFSDGMKVETDMSGWDEMTFGIALKRKQYRITKLFNVGLEKWLKEIEIPKIGCADAAHKVCKDETIEKEGTWYFAYKDMETKTENHEAPILYLRIWSNRGSGHWSYYQDFGYIPENVSGFDGFCKKLAELKWGGKTGLIGGIAHGIHNVKLQLSRLRPQLQLYVKEQEKLLIKHQHEVESHSKKSKESKEEMEKRHKTEVYEANKKRIGTDTQIKRAAHKQVKLERSMEPALEMEEIFKKANTENRGVLYDYRRGVPEFDNKDIRQQRLGDLMTLLWWNGEPTHCGKYIKMMAKLEQFDVVRSAVSRINVYSAELWKQLIV